MTKIYTITLSPAIDYILQLDQLNLNKTNRPVSTDIYAAGKGIHVAMMLNNFHLNNEAIIFTNGDFQEFFLNDLKQNQINYKNFASAGQIRINLKLIDKNQTELSVASAPISPAEINHLLDYLNSVLKAEDILILTGSRPVNSSDNIYEQIGRTAVEKGARLVVDTCGQTLINSLKNHPWLIKPNLTELESTFQVKINSFADLKKLANQLIHLGAQNVLVSMGKKGAVLINQERIFQASIPKINPSRYQLINSAGAGDSMLAGFIAKYLETQEFESALTTGILCGTATAYSWRIASQKLLAELNPYLETIEKWGEENEQFVRS